MSIITFNPMSDTKHASICDGLLEPHIKIINTAELTTRYRVFLQCHCKAVVHVSLRTYSNFAEAEIESKTLTIMEIQRQKTFRNLPKPVIFLDMDGVILAGRHWRDKRKEHIPEDTIKLLNQVVAETGAIVVISSTWRFSNALRRRLKYNGFTGEFHRDWRTPIDYTGGLQRGLEIQTWLDNHPETPNFCIIDDDSDMLEQQMPYFVKTEFEHGLLPEHVKRIVSILKGT